jgi:hypothetical protein
MVKVYRSGDQGIELYEIEAEDAKKMIAEAKSQGRFIINRQNGELMEVWTPIVKEVLIIDIVEGG